jgi:hypothetical protein
VAFGLADGGSVGFARGHCRVDGMVCGCL